MPDGDPAVGAVGCARSCLSRPGCDRPAVSCGVGGSLRDTPRKSWFRFRLPLEIGHGSSATQAGGSLEGRAVLRAAACSCGASAGVRTRNGRWGLPQPQRLPHCQARRTSPAADTWLHQAGRRASLRSPRPTPGVHCGGLIRTTPPIEKAFPMAWRLRKAFSGKASDDVSSLHAAYPIPAGFCPPVGCRVAVKPGVIAWPPCTPAHPQPSLSCALH